MAKVTVRLAFTAASLLLMAMPAWAQSGWGAGSSANNRYGTTSPGSQPSAASQSSGYQSSGYQSATSNSPAAQARPITPIGSNAGSTSGRGSTAAGSTANLTPVGSNRPSRALVSKGSGALPRDHGQVWREYDIRPYTLKVSNTAHPEQALVDWILRETGYEAWHSEPLGLLSANRETLRVYHTPDMQGVVADIIDRFVNSQADNQAFSLRIATVRNPNWRAKALALMTPISVQSPGMQGWIMPKENAALLMSELQRRSDFQEHNASNQIVLNGQSVVLSTMRPRNYIKGIVRTQNTWPGFQPESGQLEEGASMEFSPLLSLDMKSADAVVKVRIHQVEKMAPVTLDLPGMATGSQRMEIEVPQMTMANVHERFRWPADQVLLLSLGVVPPPGPSKTGNALTKMIPGMNGPPRADGLLFIEVKGTAIPSSSPGAPVSTAMGRPGSFSGRY